MYILIYDTGQGALDSIKYVVKCNYIVSTSTHYSKRNTADSLHLPKCPWFSIKSTSTTSNTTQHNTTRFIHLPKYPSTLTTNITEDSINCISTTHPMHLLKYPYTSIFIHVSFSVQQSPRQPSQSINISSLLPPLSLSLSLCFLPSFLRCYTSYLLSFFKSPCFVDLAFLFLPL